MKSFCDFCLALILPKRMVRFKKLHFLLSLAIILVATYIAIGSSNIMMKKYVEVDFLLNNGEQILEESKLMPVGDYSISKEGEFICTLTNDDHGVYHQIYDLVNGNKLDLTIVFDDTIDITSDSKDDKWFKYFDYEGYLHQTRIDNNEYYLVIYTKKNILFISNLGQTLVDNNYIDSDTTYFSVYEKDDANQYIYYLPANKDELVLSTQYSDYYDITKWTKVVQKDDKIDFTYTGDIELVPQKKHLTTLPDAVYSNKSRSYLYSNLLGVDETVCQLKDQSLKTYLDKIYQATLKDEINNEKSANALMAFGAAILIPLCLVFISWIFFKRFNLNRYREYMAIFAINYSVISLISFIVGFFMEFYTYFIFFWILIIGVYLFTTMRINSIQNKDNDDNPSQPPKEQPKEAEFKEIKSNKTNDYSQIG